MKELTVEEVLELEEGTKYIVYNPLTDIRKIEIASKRDIAHNKHRYTKLKFYLIGDHNE